jgi:hypothetical protein
MRSHLLWLRRNRCRQDRPAHRRGKEHSRKPGQGQARVTTPLRYVLIQPESDISANMGSSYITMSRQDRRYRMPRTSHHGHQGEHYSSWW